MLRIVLQTYATGQHTAAYHLKFENIPELAEMEIKQAIARMKVKKKHL